MFTKYVQQGVTLYDMMAWGKNRCAEGMGGRNAVNSGRHPTVYQKTISNINCALKLEDIHDVLKRVNNQYFYLVLRFVKRLRGGIVWICQQGMFLGATKKTEKNHGVVSADFVQWRVVAGVMVKLPDCSATNGPPKVHRKAFNIRKDKRFLPQGFHRPAPQMFFT